MPPRLSGASSILRSPFQSVSAPIHRAFSLTVPVSQEPLSPNPSSNETTGPSRITSPSGRSPQSSAFATPTNVRMANLRNRLAEMHRTNASRTNSGTEEFTPAELQKMQMRFEWGDTYAPNDLSMEERFNRVSRRRPQKDAFDVLGLNPLRQFKNFAMLGEYITSMGRIKHSRETGLRPVNQRKIAKAIRRAVGVGLLPSVHHHPEILKAMERNTRPSNRRRF